MPQPPATVTYGQGDIPSFGPGFDHWQPLLEGKENGNYQCQDHVTPRIGTEAMTYLVEDYPPPMLPPNYNYDIKLL